MKKNLATKFLSVLLAVSLVLGIAPLSGFVGLSFDAKAADSESQELITNTGDKITRAEWLHNLAVIFEMTVEDEAYPDNYFSDLEDTNEYYYDILLNVNFGVVDIEAGGEVKPDDAVTRSFASHTLNYCLGYQLEEETYTFSDADICEYPADAQVSVNRGWFTLANGNFCPDNAVTDAEVNIMIKDAQEVLESRIIDENYDSEYEFHSSVIEIPDDTAVSVEESTLTIIDCGEEIKAGDKFAAYQNGIPKIYEAVSVTVSENMTEVVVNPDFDGSDLFLAIDAEGVTDASSFEITPEEDTVMTVEETPQETMLWQRARGVVKLDTVYKFTKTIKVADGLSVACEIEMKNPKVEYRFNTSPLNTRVVFDGDAKISFKGSFDLMKAVNLGEVLIGRIGVPGIGGLDLYVNLSLGGSIGMATTGDLRFGLTITSADGLSVEKSFNQKSFVLTASATGSAGATIKFGITDAPIIKAYSFFKIGGTCGVNITDYTDKECANFSAFLYASYGAQASISFLGFSASYSKTETIWDVNNSPAKIVRHYEDGVEVCSCSRGNEIGYFTTWNSIYGGTGWLDGFGSTGYNRNREPVIIYEYTLNENNEATITKYRGNATALYIPEKIDGYTVIKLGDTAFENNKYLRFVSIPDSVTEIGKYAFKNCTNLSSVKLSNNVTSIGSEAFRNIALSEISIPDTVTFIGAAAFLACKNLSNVTLSKSLERMDAYAFGYCDSLREIEIPKSLVQTESAYYYEYNYGYWFGPFIGSDNLKSVTFEEGITTIANGLFSNMNGLEAIEIPDTVTTIKNNAFRSCVNLKYVKLSNSLTSIEKDAFRNTLLTEVIVPDSVTTIGSAAFAECAELSNVSLSKSLKTIGAYAFGYCDKLTEIEIPKSLDSTTDAYYNEFNYGYWLGPFMGSENLKTVTFEEGITEISNGLFANSNIETIEIPDTVTKIESSAFLNCVLLGNVVFSDNLTIISSNAFRNTAIAEIEIPDSVTRIDSGVFADCRNLSDVKLPKYLESIGAYAFACCEKLTSIEIPKSLKTTTAAHYNEYIYGEHFGVFYKCDNLKIVTFEEGTTVIPQGLFANNEGIEKIEIPETVTCIEQKAFLNCINLKDVTLHDGITDIGFEAFRNSGITSISIPDTVKTLDNNTFVNCTFLKYAKLSENIKTIPSSMFEGCTSLEKIEIPETVETIYNHAFKNCTSLNEVVMSNSLKKIDRYAFENCDALTEIEIPETVTVIGEGVFYDCDGISSIIIPDSVTDLGAKVFFDNDLLSEVTLGTGITKIKASSFEHCDVLGEVKVPYRVTTIESKVFKDCVEFTDITIPRLTTSIAADTFSYLNKLTITGVAGTYAETYANEYDIKFVANEVNATSVSLDRKEVAINKGQSTKLVMSVNPSDFTDAVSWKSSDTSIVTIADDGTLTAHNVGTATIKLVVGSKSASCKVTVLQPVTRIRLNSYNTSLDGGKSYQLYSTVEPGSAANHEVEWISSDESIVTVSQDGLVTAHKKGTATITVRAKDGSGVYANCTVTVTSNAYTVSGTDGFESPHNYEDNCNDFWIYTFNGTEKVGITFDDRTNIEDGFDYLYIYDKDDKEIGKYTGTELAGQTITVSGDTVKIKLVSDESGNEWGFKVERIYVDHTHTYSSEITQNATCEQVGIKTFACSCGDTYTEEIPVIGHTAGDWEIKIAATCTANGEKIKKCTICGETIETEVISVEGHDYVQMVTEPTCTEDGYTTYTCSSCGDNYTVDVIPATGHTSGAWEVVKQAACTEDGQKAKKCTVCGKTVKTQVITAGHTWSEWEVTTQPTITTDGTKVRTCTVCNDATEEATIPKTGITITLTSSDNSYSAVVDGDLTTYSFKNIENGDYVVTVSKTNYVTREYQFSVTDNNVTVNWQLNLIGDINGDGKISILDYTKVLRHVKKTELLDGYELLCGDIDGSGKIAVSDYAKILRHVKKTEMLW